LPNGSSRLHLGSIRRIWLADDGTGCRHEPPVRGDLHQSGPGSRGRACSIRTLTSPYRAAPRPAWFRRHFAWLMTRRLRRLDRSPTIEITHDGGVTWDRSMSPPLSGYAGWLCLSLHARRIPFDSSSTLEGLSASPVGNTSRRRRLRARTWPMGPMRLSNARRERVLEPARVPGGEIQWRRGTRLGAGARDLPHRRRGATWSFVHAVTWDGRFSFVDELNGWAVARKCR
jgi:hypothetical protein